MYSQQHSATRSNPTDKAFNETWFSSLQLLDQYAARHEDERRRILTREAGVS